MAKLFCRHTHLKNCVALDKDKGHRQRKAMPLFVACHVCPRPPAQKHLSQFGQSADFNETQKVFSDTPLDFSLRRMRRLFPVTTISLLVLKTPIHLHKYSFPDLGKEEILLNIEKFLAIKPSISPLEV